MRDVRLKFSKTGLLRFVSHLDLQRAVLRAMRRTDIPIWYTEGFNPHPYATFALPLPLGAESENDIMDIRVVGDIKNAEIAKKMNEVLPEGLVITDCYNPVNKYKQLCAAKYKFTYDTDTDINALKSVIESGELYCEKPGKSHGRKIIKTVNILEEVISCEITENNGLPVLNITLPAGSEKNVNPILLAETLKKEKNFNYLTVRRTELLTADGSFR